jgi:hypothetical protein
MRLRPYREMANDPNYLLQVGRLVGAAEMTAHFLMLGTLNAEELKNIGTRLDHVSGWFLVPEKEKKDGLGGWTP